LQQALVEFELAICIGLRRIVITLNHLQLAPENASGSINLLKRQIHAFAIRFQKGSQWSSHN